MRIHKEWDYKVQNNIHYTIRIKVGEGQKGYSILDDMNGNFIHDTETLEYSLGLGEDLVGKSIFISTTATDIRKDTNEVVVSYEMNGKLFQTDENPIESETEKHLESINFLTTINFRL